MPFFPHDGLQFHYQRSGQGIPFIFQHGLGGDLSQPIGIFTPPQGIELLSFDFRAHGGTRPLGDAAKLSFASFADDLKTFMDQMQLERAVIGGISMGAGVSLNFGLRFPDRVLGLVLSRAAWLDGAMPQNVKIFSKVSQAIGQHGAQRGLELFKLSEAYREVLQESPDVAASLLKQFESPRAEETYLRLERMPKDAPNYDRREWKSIRVPTLVLANRQDPIHPYEYGDIIAQHIPEAEFREITSKSVSLAQHEADTQNFIQEFLQRHSLQSRGAS
jgi:pimeloyl-ACP methyl ester carboxylesterase